MKRILSILLVLLLLSACGAKENPQSRSERNPSSSQSGGELSGSPLKGDTADELLSIAADFAENYPFAFSSSEQLFPDHFTLFKIYYQNPDAVDENGILWVSPERLAQEVELRFGVSDFQLREPSSENEYPRYVEEKGAIAFLPTGSASWLTAELIGQSAEGEYYDYTFGLYDDVISDEHPEKTLERTITYRFRVVETPDGAPFLQAVSAEELPEEDTPEDKEAEAEWDELLRSGGRSVLENFSLKQQQYYYMKYLYPYYLAGLTNYTWSDPEEIEVWLYMRFYIYNESTHYWSENPVTEGHSIPWYTVEDFITSYFEVSPGYLRTAENYDSATACFRLMMTEGIGDGPGLSIERIEIDGDRCRFVCRDINGDLCSVTIRIYSEYFFHYVAGEGRGL